MTERDFMKSGAVMASADHRKRSNMEMEIDTARNILAILDKANENDKFAVPVTAVMVGDHIISTFELGIGIWFKLIDVAPIGELNGEVCRVFKLTPTGKAIRERAREVLAEAPFKED